ncbi:MAG TPA: MFS transporter [Thermomicrobiales bacterium]|nr:MFS transporter [Thermomicrobiales bacterium]
MNRRTTPIFALLAANTLSFIAEGISVVAIPWFVLQLTGSYAQMGIIGFFTVLPRVIATFLGGQFVDRIGFRTSGVASDILSGLSVCGIPILHATDHLSFTWLIVLVIVGAVFDGPGATAKEAMVPELAAMAEIDLDRVNAFFQGSRRLSTFIGPMIAGFLVAWVGTSNVLWVNAVVFAASAILIMTLIPPMSSHQDGDEVPASFVSNMLFGFRFLRQHRLLLWLAGIICLTNFLDAPLATVQIPALVNEFYGSAALVGVLLGAHGIGAVISTIIFSGIAPRLSRRKTFIVCFLAVAPSGLIISTVPPYPVVVGIAVVMGLFAGPINPILMSVRQERVPVQYRARVFGSLTAIAFIAIPLGQLLGGSLVEWFGVRPVFAGVSIVYTLLVVSFFFTPALREMDERPGMQKASLVPQS